MKIGDIVSLKSNLKVKMTISEVSENGFIECVWINKAHTLSGGTFAQSMLHKEIIIPETEEGKKARIEELVKKATKKE
jgi:uncharacterized protein YodC (DUF2158 family)